MFGPLVVLHNMLSPQGMDFGSLSKNKKKISRVCLVKVVLSLRQQNGP